MKQTQNHSTGVVDDRIKTFLKGKMEEFPELRKKYGFKLQDVRRTDLFESVLSYFSKRARA